MPMSKSINTAQQQFTTEVPGKTADSKKLINIITEGLLEKKAKEIKILDVRNITTLTDYFVICHGTSETQIRAIANSAIEKVKEKAGEAAWKQEGMDARRWIILDYVNVVVHIFSEEKRQFYGIERMWNDAIFTDVTES
jgi:ribosome-associated protein